MPFEATVWEVNEHIQVPQYMTHEYQRLSGAVERLGVLQNENYEKIMQAITDFATGVQASLDTLSTDLTAITTEIAALNTQIQAFNNSPGTLSPADQTALTTIATNAAALATKATAMVPPPVVPPAPAAA